MLSACGIAEMWGNIHDSVSGSAFSASCYSAVLKSTPEDFVVVEVDDIGQRTYPLTPEFKFVASRVNSTTEDSDVDTASVVDEVEMREGSSAPLRTEDLLTPVSVPKVLTLEELERSSFLTQVTDLVYQRFGSSSALLEQFRHSPTVNSMREASSEIHRGLQPSDLSYLLSVVLPPSACPSLPPTSDSPVSWLSESIALPIRLAEPSSPAAVLPKEERLRLHIYLRSRFPFLRSVVEDRSPSGAAGPTLVLSVDPGWVLFALLLGNDAALHIASWGLQRLRGSRTGAESTDVAPQFSGKLLEPVEPIDAFERALNAADCLGSADVYKIFRRAMHQVLRQAYPFVRCRVSNSIVHLCYQPPKPKPAAAGNGSPHSKRPRSGSREGAPSSGDSEAPLKKCPATSFFPAKFVYAVVKKYDVDTAEMKELLADFFHVSPQTVCTAGMKDKKAVTYQRLSIPLSESFEAKSSLGLVYPIHLTGRGDEACYVEVLAVSAPRYFSQPIRIGSLQGNWFSITLREVHQRDDDDSLVGSAGQHTSMELERRLERVARVGFLNYFGQQRFSESVVDLRDHTGLYLFSGDWISAVRSLFRAAPDFYAQFPDKMDPRCAPGNSRDMQLMVTALKFTYKSFFSEHPLDMERDVRQGSPIWKRICEVALTKVSYALRSMWVHAGQSLFFNQCATVLVRKAQDLLRQREPPEKERRVMLYWLRQMSIPMGGGQSALEWSDRTLFHYGKEPQQQHSTPSSVPRTSGVHEEKDAEWANHPSSPHYRAELRQCLLDAMETALEQIGFTPPSPESTSTSFLPDRVDIPHAGPLTNAFLSLKKVCGVPIATSWRKVFVFPTDIQCTPVIPESAGAGGGPSLNVQLSFYLPSSSYATVLLREVFGREEWW